MNIDDRIKALSARLRTAATISADVLDEAERFVEKRLEDVSVQLSSEELRLCSQVGRDPKVLALSMAKQRADAAVVAKLQPEQRKIIQVCDGGSDATMAEAARRNGWV